jgi:uncharacterized protein (TIGR00106 family)
MAIAEITIIPIGTGETSVSRYVAGIHRLLQEAPEALKYELTPMSTLLEGDLDDLFAIIRRMHELPFADGAQRVSTSVKIDDRRDKASSMESKLQSVADKLQNNP